MLKRKLSAKVDGSTGDMAKLLDDIAQSLRAGTLALYKGEEVCAIRPGGPGKIKIEVKGGKTAQSLEIGIKWPIRLKQGRTPEPVCVTSRLPEPPPGSAA